MGRVREECAWVRAGEGGGGGGALKGGGGHADVGLQEARHAERSVRSCISPYRLEPPPQQLHTCVCKYMRLPNGGGAAHL